LARLLTTPAGHHLKVVVPGTDPDDSVNTTLPLNLVSA
jgi:hypothetical protein